MLYHFHRIWLTPKVQRLSILHADTLTSCEQTLLRPSWRRGLFQNRRFVRLKIRLLAYLLRGCRRRYAWSNLVQSQSQQRQQRSGLHLCRSLCGNAVPDLHQTANDHRHAGWPLSLLHCSQPLHRPRLRYRQPAGSPRGYVRQHVHFRDERP